MNDRWKYFAKNLQETLNFCYFLSLVIVFVIFAEAWSNCDTRKNSIRLLYAVILLTYITDKTGDTTNLVFLPFVNFFFQHLFKDSDGRVSLALQYIIGGQRWLTSTWPNVTLSISLLCNKNCLFLSDFIEQYVFADC